MCRLWCRDMFRLPHVVLRGIVLPVVWRLPRDAFLLEETCAEHSISSNRSIRHERLATVCCQTKPRKKRVDSPPSAPLRMVLPVSDQFVIEHKVTANGDPMEHPVIRWNPATREHFCPNCGRTSDATNIADAQQQLEQYECEIPSVEAPRADSGMKTVRLNRKSQKRSL
jgi:hypothetical protein